MASDIDSLNNLYDLCNVDQSQVTEVVNSQKEKTHDSHSNNDDNAGDDFDASKDELNEYCAKMYSETHEHNGEESTDPPKIDLSVDPLDVSVEENSIEVPFTNDIISESDNHHTETHPATFIASEIKFNIPSENNNVTVVGNNTSTSIEINVSNISANSSSEHEGYAREAPKNQSENQKQRASETNINSTEENEIINPSTIIDDHGRSVREIKPGIVPDKTIQLTIKSLNLVMLLDGTASVGEPSFEHMLSFCRNVVMQLLDSINLNIRIRLIIVQFAELARVEFVSNVGTRSKSDIDKILSSIIYMNSVGAARIDTALEIISKNLLPHFDGEVSGYQSINQLVLVTGSRLVITEYEKVLLEIEMTKTSMEIQSIICVGFSNFINATQLAHIAGNKANVFIARTADDLNFSVDIAQRILGLDEKFTRQRLQNNGLLSHHEQGGWGQNWAPNAGERNDYAIYTNRMNKQVEKTVTIDEIKKVKSVQEKTITNVEETLAVGSSKRSGADNYSERFNKLYVGSRTGNSRHDFSKQIEEKQHPNDAITGSNHDYRNTKKNTLQEHKGTISSNNFKGVMWSDVRELKQRNGGKHLSINGDNAQLTDDSNEDDYDAGVRVTADDDKFGAAEVEAKPHENSLVLMFSRQIMDATNQNSSNATTFNEESRDYVLEKFSDNLFAQTRKDDYVERVDRQMCPDSAFDIIFLVDISSGITEHNWHHVCMFLALLIRPKLDSSDSSKVKDDYIRVGLAQFHRQFQVRFTLDYNIKLREVVKTLETLPYLQPKKSQSDNANAYNTGVFLAEVLRQTSKIFLSGKFGDRRSVPNRIFVITDSYSIDHPIHVANEIRRKDNKIFTIGIGSQVDDEMLYSISSAYFKIAGGLSTLMPSDEAGKINKTEIQSIASKITNQTLCLGSKLTAQLVEIIGDVGMLAGPDAQMANEVRIKDATSFVMSIEDPSIRLKIGHQFNESIIRCTFDGKDCMSVEDNTRTKRSSDESTALFNTWLSPRFGNCFTFNYNSRAWAARTGKLAGLSLLLHSNTSEYSCLTETAGFIVYVHSQAVHPFPEERGMYTKAASRMEFTLRREFAQKLPRPYSDCVLEQNEYNSVYGQPFYKFRYRGEYTTGGCQRSQLQNFFVKRCNCSTPFYGMLPNDTQCALKQKKCVDEALKCTGYVMERAYCPSPCKKDAYLITTTSTVIRPEYAYIQFCKSRGISMDDCKDTILHQLTVVDMFLTTLTYKVFREIPTYTIAQVMSNVGGALGLLTGMSVILLVELVLIIGSCSCCCLSEEDPYETDYY